jgi:hypothetical protein
MKVLSLAIATALTIATAAAESPRPLTPIMGWSSWNHFRIKINEKIILGQADAMASNGMKKVGYSYVNIDDGFFGGRDNEGNLESDPKVFPNGMKHVADYIHKKGLKAGIYSDIGKNTCGSHWDKDPRGIGSGLFNHEKEDLTLMLKTWGYDFIKIDWCGGDWQKLNEQKSYTKVGKLIREIRPDVVYNICRWQYPGDWAKDVADSWRVSHDITNEFSSILKIIDQCEPLWKHAGPGNINDMDMLQVGRGMTPEQDKTHFSMWCMMASPLLAGNDLRDMTKETLKILTNEEVIAINQDPLVYQARRLIDHGDEEIWARPLVKLGGGQVAVALLNRGGKEKDISVKLSDLGIDASKGYIMRDCWQHKTIGKNLRTPIITRKIPAHGIVVLRIKGSHTGKDVFKR